MKIQVVGAENLKSTDYVSGKSDPYVQVKLTQRSQTEIRIFFNTTLINWVSKQQNTVETPHDEARFFLAKGCPLLGRVNGMEAFYKKQYSTQKRTIFVVILSNSKKDACEFVWCWMDDA